MSSKSKIPPVIQVENLHVRYGDSVAVEDISFDVRANEILAIVGPNGAGKTTTVESLIGLRQPTSGRISVLGRDPQRQRLALTQDIGVQLQQAALPPNLKVWEAADLYSSFYDRTLPWPPLVAEWGLAAKQNSRFDQLSGGQRQRLFIILALLNDPQIVFLDELTTGLDPQARHATWDLIRTIQAKGKTVVLITHFMEEAQVLADRVAIIDHGRLVALDKPQRLIEQAAIEQRIEFATVEPFQLDLLEHVQGITSIRSSPEAVIVTGRQGVLPQLVTLFSQRNLTLQHLQTHQPTLEDVFLSMTVNDRPNDERLSEAFANKTDRS